MDQVFNHQEIARELAKATEEKANNIKQRKLYKEPIFQQLIKMEKVDYMSSYDMKK